MASAIFVRSPRIITVTGSVNDTIVLELYIWNSPSSIPGTPTYTLTKTIPTTLIGEASFNISEFCREYIDMTVYSEVTTDTAVGVDEYCYCSAYAYIGKTLQTIYEFICFDGYGYHSSGYNPSYSGVFMDSGNYYVQSSGNSGGVTYFDGDSATWESKYTGLISGGVTTTTLVNTVGRVPYINPSYINEGNKLEMLRNSVVIATYYFYPQEECKYEPINCDFVNKQGVWQRLVFFKASKSSLSMTNTEYNLMPESLNYSLEKNVRQVFNVNASESITCNTGWVYEAYSDVMKQLELSEEIRLDDIPVILDTKSINLQKNINDKNINYEITFRYSAPVLNYNI